MSRDEDQKIGWFVIGLVVLLPMIGAWVWLATELFRPELACLSPVHAGVLGSGLMAAIAFTLIELVKSFVRLVRQERDEKRAGE